MKIPGVPIDPLSLLKAAEDVEAGAEKFRPVVVSGVGEAPQHLYLRLREGAGEDIVRNATARRPVESDLDGAGVLVHVFEGHPSPQDEEAFTLGARKGVQLVAVASGAPDGLRLRYVLADDVVVVDRPPIPVDRVAGRIAARAGKGAYGLAAAMPSIRPQVVDRIIASAVRRNALVGAAVFLPGVDFAAMTVTQAQMVLRIAAAHGHRLDTRERVFEILAVVGAAFGWRGAARQLVSHVPGPTWMFKAGVGAAGTKAVGEAAAAYFDARPAPTAEPAEELAESQVADPRGTVRSGS